MSDVYVVNHGDRPYVEEFEDEQVVIPAGDKVKMKRRQAKKFLGTYSGWDHKRGIMKEKPLHMEDIDPNAKEEEPEQQFVSPKTGEDFKTQAELDAHLKKYQDEVYKDESIEDRLKDKK